MSQPGGTDQAHCCPDCLPCPASPLPRALGAADIAVLARAERLTAPRGQCARVRSRAALTSTVTAIVAGPLITVALAASGVLMCGIP